MSLVQAQSGSEGFSLIELVMVMLLVGIMANIVIPLIRPAKFRQDSAVLEVGSMLTAQQRMAILRQHDIVIRFDTVNGVMRIHDDEDNDGDLDSTEPWHVQQLPDGVFFGRGGAPARALGTTAVNMTEKQDGAPALTFHRNGSGSEQALIYLTSDRSSDSGAFPQDARAVEVGRATGRVTCYSYRTGTWERSC